uniref:Uncharacterized protein n=1 Tax=Physcomitrium patens TaxID=3218 RepID=A0A2K1IFZ1_PHYPA|nr:hypothetical protein PHYPA_028787 [Physcomitrium patens]
MNRWASSEISKKIVGRRITTHVQEQNRVPRAPRRDGPELGLEAKEENNGENSSETSLEAGRFGGRSSGA